MGFQCGIVGLPNVGKSTLFNALTQAGIEAQNYPFCTIEPNVGTVCVPDPRLDALANIVNPEKVIPTTMSFVDIAGLVKGAHQGEGLGNQFLGTIRDMDAIAHVVRCFEDTDIIHVDGQIDPIRDIETIHLELILSDLDSVTKAIEKLKKVARSGNKAAVADMATLEALQIHLDAGKMAATFDGDIDPQYRLLTTKPLLFIANVDEQGLHDNPWVEKVKDYAKTLNAPVVTLCAAIESELAELDDEDKMSFLGEYGLSAPGLNRLIHEGYQRLQLHTYFTAGVKEVRAWTIPMASTAPEAAGKIHTDFQKGFIRAEVVSYDDFTTYQGESGAKEAGKWRLEGKDYIVADGDVIHFRFNV